MNGKTVIVTGGNCGIGKETAKALAQQGARVILACRNMETGRKAQNEIIEETKNPNILLKNIDLSSRKSIYSFAEDINSSESQLHVLIHNAGVAISKNVISADGIEMTMATNHFGPFLLTNLLIDLLKQSAPSRIVIVASITHFLGSIDTKYLNRHSSFLPQWNYFNSKLANICFTRELAKRLKYTNITVNCVHPGFIDTDMWNAIPKIFSLPLNIINKYCFKTCKEGCQTTVYLASSDEVVNETGKYFVDCKKAYMSKSAHSARNGAELWKRTQNILNLSDQDMKM